jgi:pseudaminic acid cytidylyltransferase
MSTMGNIAIIPARGGSKRIPHKNIKDFCGKPIIVYSIQVALRSGLFDEVMVSTDDEEIAKIATEYGAKIPFMRSKMNSDDHATTMDVIQEVLTDYKEKQNREFQFACCIYATAPLIQIGHLYTGFSLMVRQGFSSVFPVVLFSYPIWRGLYVRQDGTIKMLYPEYRDSRSQDLKEVYHDAGQWYWLDINRVTNTLFTDNSGSVILQEEETQDIDTPSDWLLAEMKKQRYEEV